METCQMDENIFLIMTLWMWVLVGIGPLFQSVAWQMQSNVFVVHCVYVSALYLHVYLWLKT